MGFAQLFFEMETEERASFTAMLLRASPLFASVPSVTAEVGQRRQCLPTRSCGSDSSLRSLGGVEVSGWYPPDGPIRRVGSAAQVDEAEAAMLAAKAARLMTVDVEVDFFPDFVAFI